MSVPLDFRLSIIIPVKRDDPFIERCLSAALSASQVTWEIILILDGWQTNRLHAFQDTDKVRVFSHPSAGPASCRHFGACQAVHDWLCFLDSDVLVHAGTFEKALSRLTASGDDGLIGSYDDAPEDASTISKFRNLLHHYHHQRNHGRAGVFWGAFGIVRKSSYLSAGGFDPAYRKASVEDIELGYRLAAKGFVIRIQSEVQVCHLKRWTLKNMIHTDIWLRAMPWTVLMRRYNRWDDRPLNITLREQCSAILAVLFTLTLTAVFLIKWIWVLSLICLICFLFIQWDFYRFAVRHFPLSRIPLVGALHHIYFCSAAAGWMLASVLKHKQQKQLHHG
jgi:glycosyltransferase involved in cell wall biosynthesis